MRFLLLLFLGYSTVGQTQNFLINDLSRIKSFEDFPVAVRSAKGDEQKIFSATKRAEKLPLRGSSDFYITDMMLGKGGFKEVFLGIKGGNNFSFIAIAVMTKNAASLDIAKSSEKLMKVFPNSPKGIEPFLLVDSTSIPGKVYVATPLYVGDFNTLKDFLYSGKHYMKATPSCFRDVINGVNFIHSKNLSHGDIKPANFLFSPIGNTGRLKCDVADLDSLYSVGGYYTPHYYPFVIEEGRRPVDKFKRDRYSVSLSLLEVMSWVSDNGRLDKEVEDYQNLSAKLGEIPKEESIKRSTLSNRRGPSLNTQMKQDIVSAMNRLAYKIGEDIKREAEYCRGSTTKYCPLFQNEIIDYIFKNFVSLHRRS